MSEEQSTESGFKYNVCASCNASTNTDGNPIFLRCGTCKGVYYCNRVCQKKHWKTEHKAVCKPPSPTCEVCSLEFLNSKNLVPIPMSIEGRPKIFDACASCVKQIVDRAEMGKEEKMPCELCDEMIMITDFTTPSIYKREGISYHIRTCVSCIQKQETFAQANEDTEEFRELLKGVDKSIIMAQELFQLAQTKHEESVKEKEKKKKKKGKTSI